MCVMLRCLAVKVLAWVKQKTVQHCDFSKLAVSLGFSIIATHAMVLCAGCGQAINAHVIPVMCLSLLSTSWGLGGAGVGI